MLRDDSYIKALELVAVEAEKYLHATGNDFFRDIDGKLFYNLIQHNAGPLYDALDKLPKE